MTQYIQEVKRQLRDVYEFSPSSGTLEDPNFDNIPDGTYPMDINGKQDKVEIKDGLISCCNF